MSVESDLKKDGIEVIKKLDTLKINSIAKNVSTHICETFPNFNFTKTLLFISTVILTMKTLKNLQYMNVFIISKK